MAADETLWRQKVADVLKGKDFDRALTSRSQDGLVIQPLYAKAKAGFRSQRGSAGPWRIFQRVDHPDAVTAAELAVEDVAGGADGLVLCFHGAPTARAFGILPDDVETILESIDLTRIALRLDPAPHQGSAAANAVVEAIQSRLLDPGSISVDFGIDPIGDMARTGVVRDGDIARAIELVPSLGDLGFSGPILRADGRVHHDAGASEAQEIAGLLSTGVAYLRAMETASILLEVARGALGFLLTADGDEFLSVAKFRAMRRLWAVVEAACGLAPRPMSLAAETSYRMTTRTDAHVNLLRNTMATFSAAVGGADAITVLPHTAPLGLADAAARRLARNTQAILIEESHVGHVLDPVGGAGGFEALTDELSAKAWAIFQEIETAGGLASMLRSGQWQALVARSREVNAACVARRQHPLTGTTEFPLLGEVVPSVLQPMPAPIEVTGADFPALTPARLAEPFERLRAKAEAMGASVLLVTLGKPADFSARAGFAKTLFEEGGIRALGGSEAVDVAHLAQIFQQSGARIACLCSSDELYDSDGQGGTLAQMAARALAEAGCRVTIRTGRPSANESQDRASGIGGFIAAGMDALAFLEDIIARLGDKP